jgi:hypothetical protein
MRLSLKNGFVRLAIVFFVGWSLVWGTLIYRAVAKVDSWRMAVGIWQQNYEIDRKLGEVSKTTEDFTNESFDRFGEAVVWLAFVEKVGIGGLFVIPAAFASAVWVWFGFKRQISN